jgi:hypothetical protein
LHERATRTGLEFISAFVHAIHSEHEKGHLIAASELDSRLHNSVSVVRSWRVRKLPATTEEAAVHARKSDRQADVLFPWRVAIVDTSPGTTCSRRRVLEMHKSWMEA